MHARATDAFIALLSVPAHCADVVRLSSFRGGADPLPDLYYGLCSHNCAVSCIEIVLLAGPSAESDNIIALFQELEEPAERDRFQSTIPQQLSVIWNTLQAGDEGTAQEALELFIEVAEAHPRFLRKNLTEIVNAMLQVGTILQP